MQLSRQAGTDECGYQVITSHIYMRAAYIFFLLQAAVSFRIDPDIPDIS
jgi:hypothetical protein